MRVFSFLSSEMNYSLCFLSLDGAISMVLDKPDFADPAHVRLTCDISPNVTSISNITFMQIRRVQKNHNTEVIAYANISAHYGTVVENASFTRKGMIISGSINQSEARNSMLKIESWICEHAGSYICDVFYTAADQPKFTMAGIRVDNPCGCLLYTSPSPRDRHRSRMPSSA